MIPKKIHYCWFGGNPLPPETKKCIDSWKKYCPDYEIIEWNELNYDINKNEYTKLAYENKKYAFLTDYVRLDVIFNEGGIYLDTDVELIKKIDDLLECDAYFAMEEVGRVATGLGFGAKQGNEIVKKNKEYYEKNSFIDSNGNFKKVICVEITTNILKEIGLENENKIQKLGNIIIYPPEYFCPKKMGTNIIKLTNKTYSIHHYDATWKSNNWLIRKIGYYMIIPKKIIKKIFRFERKL